jgi:hypothetical protein
METTMSVTIGFSTTNKLLSHVIRWITRAPCSHAWFCYEDLVVGTSTPISKIAQAEWYGYEARPRWRWDRENTLIAEFELLGPDPALAVRYMLNQYLGARYDYLAAFFTGLWQLTKRTLRGKFRDPKKLMCSEGVIRMLGHAGYNAVSDLDPEVTSPKALMMRCFRTPTEFRVKHATPTIIQTCGLG